VSIALFLDWPLTFEDSVARQGSRVGKNPDFLGFMRVFWFFWAIWVICFFSRFLVMDILFLIFLFYFINITSDKKFNF